MKRIFLICLAVFQFLASSGAISDIERAGNWYYLYNEKGRRYKTLGASGIGEIKGWSSSFFVSQKDNWIYLYDENGKRYKTLGKGNVGEIISVSGNTFTSRKGNWIYTYDSNGKRIYTRSAH